MPVEMPTQYRLVSAIEKRDKRGAGYLANIILNGCRRPVTKLRGLLRLVEANKHVTTAPGDNFSFLVDGVYIGSVDLLEAYAKKGAKLP